MVVCLERGADLHMALLMPLPLAVSCSSKIQIGFTFLVPAHLGSPGKRAVKRVCVYVCVCIYSVLELILAAWSFSLHTTHLLQSYQPLHTLLWSTHYLLTVPLCRIADDSWLLHLESGTVFHKEIMKIIGTLKKYL